MGPTPSASRPVRRWPAALTAGVVAALFAALVLWGIEWGVPSRERAALEGVAEEARHLPPELKEEPWRHKGSRGRESELAEGFHRHLFNPLRSYHPDEYQVFKSLSSMRPRRLDFDPGNYIYPSLHTYLVGGALGACSLVGAVRLEPDLEYYFDHPDALGRLYLVGRAVSLLAALAALGLVWRVGERMQRGTGLLAMALLAVMPALMVHSHNLTRDTCTAVAAVVLFACCRRLAATGKGKWYDYAGGAAGLCAAFQYFAVVLWALVPVAAGLRLWRRGGSGRRAAVGVGCSAAVMVAVFFLTSPYHFVNGEQFLADFRSETAHVGQEGVVGRLASFAWATHMVRMLPAMATWPLAAVVGLGVLVALVRRRAGDWLLLAWLGLWAGVVGFDGRSYSRYYVGLLPCLALLGGGGLAWLGGAVGRAVRPRGVRAGLAAAALAGVLVPAAAMSWGWARLYSRENVRTVAGQWIHGNVPPGATVGVTRWPWQFELPPLDSERYRLVVLAESRPQAPRDAALLMQLRPDYFVTSSLQFGKIDEGSEPTSRADRFWHFLLAGRQAYRVAAEFHLPLRGFGREVDLWGYPEDMRYVNPRIVVLEWHPAEAMAARPGERP
ncbi:MAG: glycosyltransferase family 39 protein [Candidatus Brocadiia bacterium]